MTETAKFYTKARRIPMLVGKLPSGGRIWGGPYTITQVGAGALVAFALWKTAPLWAQLGGFMNIVVAVGVVVGTVWATGKLPNSGRNPIAFVMDAMNLTSTPGRLSGGQLVLPKPRLVTNRVMVVVPRQTSVTAPPPAPGVRTAAPQRPTVVRPVPTELLPELVATGPADSTLEGRQLEPAPGRPTRPPAGAGARRPAARADKRSPADWATAAATAAAERKDAERTGVDELLAGRPAPAERPASPTPRED